MLRLEPRKNRSNVLEISAPVMAVILTMVFGGLLFYLLGKNPFEAIKLIFWDPIMSPTFSDYSRPQLVVKAAPLILIALGLSFGFRANIWNIGAEGQYIMGALVSAAIGLAFYPLQAWYIFPLMIAGGILGGVIWAMIPALLKIKFNTNEILVSLMLVYVAEQILALASVGFLRNPDGLGFPGSRDLSKYQSAANLELIPGTGIHFGVVAAFLGVVFLTYFLTYHRTGFQIKLIGQAPRAAKFSGVNLRYIIIFCLGLSGGLAGIAGMFELTGPAGLINIDFNVGYGFTAIIVAFLGRLHPIGILLAGLLMSLTYVGGELAQFMMSIPAAAIQVFQGMLLFFLLSTDLLVNYKITFMISSSSKRAD